MQLTRKQMIAVIYKIAADEDYRVYESYSGRGMFGQGCYGLVGRDAEKCIGLVSQFDFPGLSRDSMGLDTIVYWPSIEMATKEEREDPDFLNNFPNEDNWESFYETIQNDVSFLRKICRENGWDLQTDNEGQYMIYTGVYDSSQKEEQEEV